MSEPVTSNYAAGAALDNNTSLFGDAVNLQHFTLTTPVGTADTTLTTSSSLASVNVPCYIYVDNEIIYAQNKTSTDFTNCVRGVGGTLASHLAGAIIYVTYAANMFNQLKRAIIAIETVLGTVPQSTYANVAARLTQDELGIALTAYATSSSLIGTLTLTDASMPIQIVTAAAPQTIVLPATASTNHPFYIIVKTGSASITIQNAAFSTIDTLTAPSLGIYLSDGSTNWYKQSTGGGSGGGSFINELFNSDFALFERQISPSTLTAYANGAYHMDRWYMLTDGGATDIQIAQDVGDTLSPYACQMKQTNAVAKHMGIAQVLNAKKSISLRGKNLIFQIRVKSSSTPNIRVAILEWTGTADSPTKNVVNNWASTNYTAGNFFLAANLTVSAVSSSVAASGSYSSFSVSATLSNSCNNVYVFVWTEGSVAQNVTVNVSQSGLYTASSIQTWEAPDSGLERERCYHYAKRLIIPPSSSIAVVLGYRSGASAIYGGIPLSTRMRTTPTVTHNVSGWATTTPTGTLVAAADQTAGGFVTITGALSVAVTDIGTDSARLGFTAATSFSGASGDFCDMRIGPNVVFWADAELGV